MGIIRTKYNNDKKLAYVGIIVWLLITSVCIAGVLQKYVIPIEYVPYYVIVLLIPFLLLAGLYGYLVCMISFSLCFIISLIVKPDIAYSLSIYLVAMFCYSLFAQYFWFYSIIKTVIANIATALITSLMIVFCFVMIPNNIYTLGAFEGLLKMFIFTFIAVSFCSLVLFLYFNHADDKYKMSFPLAYGYTKEYQKSDLKRFHKKTKVSFKITTIVIVVEVALSIFVAGYIALLFPDVRTLIGNNVSHMIEYQQQHQELIGDASHISDLEKNRFLYYIYNVDYQMDDMALSFDLKMCLLILCCGVPMAAIANFYAKTEIGEPLGIMTTYMNNFLNSDDEEKGELIRKTFDIEIHTGDEIEVLADYAKITLRAMGDYIENFKEQQTLSNEVEILKHANEAKSAFLSSMSHEIRTPINAIIGMNEMILRECEDPQIIEYANNAKSAGNSLLSLVNDILDFSKIEAGKMEILPVQYDLASMINDLVNMVATKAHEKGLELEINIDSKIPGHLMGDEIRLKQVVTNLLTNAVKYTEQGAVALSITYQNEDDNNILLHFEVSDTGIGIKKEDLAKLYSPFERIEEIRNRTIEGTGLGMTIVKKLLALMDTKLIVESEYGVGSSFRFFVKQQVVTWDPIGDFKTKYKEYVKSKEEYHQRFEAPDAKVLVVDDTEMNLTVIKSLLKKTKVQIDTVDSGFKTLQKVRENEYDVIFLDHRMPEMDGVETFEKMKTMPDNLNIGVPTIALTANAISGAREEYLGYGFTDYLAKPVSGEELEKMLERYLPKEKIVAVSIEHGEDEFEPSFSEVVSDDSFLTKLEGIDLQEAIKNCGDADVLENVVKDFLNSLDTKADAIERFLDEGDLRNYTVLVHALKSSARLIGAMELSELAAELEEMGDFGNVIEIREKTKILLYKYRAYKDLLRPACEESKDDLPEIAEEDVVQAFRDIKDLVEVYDYDTADTIMKMLEEYRIPDSLVDKYNKLSQLLRSVEREEILKLL